MRYIPFRKIFSKKQKYCLWPIYICALFAHGILFWILWNKDLITNAFYRSSYFWFGILMALVNILLDRKRVREHLFTSGLNMCMVIMTVTIASYLENQYLNSTGIWKYINNAWLICVIFLIAYPLFQMLIVHTVTPFLILERNDYWTRIWSIPCLIYLACYTSFPVDFYTVNQKLVIILVLLNFAAIMICHSITEDYQRLIEREQMNQQLNRQKEYYTELSKRVEEARKIRHDFKNHVMAIRNFVVQDDKEGLLHYCEDLEVPGVQNISIPHTRNAAADGVFYHYMGLAKEYGISFHISGVFGELSIADIDLCVLLGNALDNAVSACCMIPKEKRFINLAISLDGDVLAIMIRNSFDGIILEEDGVMLSRKREHETGIGLKSMKDICGKYHGSLQTRYEKQEFFCMILINNIIEHEGSDSK